MSNSSAIVELRADFKRVYIHFFDVDGWNEAVEENSLPEWLGFTKADVVKLDAQEKTSKVKE